MNEDQVRMLAETNTMVKMIYAELPKLATCERVDAVEDKADHAYAKAASVHAELVEHTKDHQSLNVNRNLIAGSYAGVLVTFLGLIYAIFGKKGTP